LSSRTFSRFAQEAKRATLDVLVHQAANSRLAQAAQPGQARELVESRSEAGMRIQASQISNLIVAQK
jgi:NADPH-dependent ferric siderophore reductase